MLHASDTAPQTLRVTSLKDINEKLEAGQEFSVTQASRERLVSEIEALEEGVAMALNKVSMVKLSALKDMLQTSISNEFSIGIHVEAHHGAEMKAELGNALDNLVH